MKLASTCFFIVLICFSPGMVCFAQEETVTSDNLSREDIEQALFSGAIISNCGLHGFPEYGATSLSPDTVIIRGISQKGREAVIHFMGRFKATVRADERPVACEAYLQHLDSGEWVDPNGVILKRQIHAITIQRKSHCSFGNNPKQYSIKPACFAWE